MLQSFKVIVVVLAFVSAIGVLSFTVIHFFLGLIYRNRISQLRTPGFKALDEGAEFPSVLLQLPVYNERYVIERLIRRVAKMDYPKERLAIQLLDDSTDDTSEIASRVISELREQGLNVSHIRRKNRTGYKAGALQHGMSLVDSEFIAIFDADFLPRPDFLKLILPYFALPEVGMVQARWEHLNAESSIVTRALALSIDNHFSVEHEGRQGVDGFIHFNGTAGVWRREAIEDSGGWASDTLTEDLDLSFRSQLRGWKFVFARDVDVPAELPTSMSAVRSQQYRWAKGPAEVGRKSFGSLWRSNAPLPTKVLGSFHMLNSFVFLGLLISGISAGLLPFLALPYFSLVAGLLNSILITATLLTVLTYWLSQRDGRFAQQRFGDLRLIQTTVLFLLLATGLSAHCSMAVIHGLLGKATPFVRTPKTGLLPGTSGIPKTHKPHQHAFPPIVIVEFLLALMFALLFAVSFKSEAIAFAGIYAFYAIGFTLIITLTVMEVASSRAV